MKTNGATLLSVRGAHVFFGQAEDPVRAVDGVDLEVQQGEVVALVGESGCGKSALALSLARLLKSPPARYAGGVVELNGRNLWRLPMHAVRALRGRELGYVFQEPLTALNPVLRVDFQLREAVRVRGRGAQTRRVAELLRQVELPAERVLRAYPHELSGGMQQRVVLAMALAGSPALLVADEPTTALDVTIQAQILQLLHRLRAELNLAVLLITHNFGLVADLADRVYVMYAGRMVEQGRVQDVLRRPAHPYTHGLLRVVPSLADGDGRQRREGIPGTVPPLNRLPPGCAYAGRCERATPACRERRPQLAPVTCDGHAVRCFCPYDGMTVKSRK